jgi:hypothetical protein
MLTNTQIRLIAAGWMLFQAALLARVVMLVVNAQG